MTQRIESKIQASCFYCNGTKQLAKCSHCNNFFCNARLTKMNERPCHIVAHLQLAHHSSIEIADKSLKCSKCSANNLFNLYRNSTGLILCNGCVDVKDSGFTKIVETCPLKLNTEVLKIPDANYLKLISDLKSEALANFKDEDEYLKSLERTKTNVEPDSSKSENILSESSKNKYDSVDDYLKNRKKVIMYSEEQKVCAIQDPVYYLSVNLDFDEKKECYFLRVQNIENFPFQLNQHYRFFNKKKKINVYTALRMDGEVFDGEMRFFVLGKVSDRLKTLLTRKQMMNCKNSSQSNSNNELVALDSMKDCKFIDNVIGNKKSRASKYENLTSDLHFMNDEQYQGMMSALNEDWTIIQGPPGTGKSRCGALICLELLRRNENSSVLVTGPSNACCDRIYDLIKEIGGKFLASNEIFRLYAKSRDIGSKTDLKKCTLGSKIVVSTCYNASPKNLFERKFKFLIVDEASRAQESEVLVPITNCSEKLILIGDQSQTDPIVIDNEIIEKGYGGSLMDRLIKNGYEYIMLKQQYRMNSFIYSFSNEQFYENKIKSDNLGSVEFAPEKVLFFDSRKPSMFFDCSQTFEEISDICGTSYQNRMEALLIIEILKKLSNFNKIKVSIVCFYSGQLMLVKKLLKPLKDEMSGNGLEISAFTTDSVQGQENDYVLVAFTRTKRISKFINDKRINVALTRARKGVIVYGAANAMNDNPTLKKYVEFNKKNRIFGTSDFIKYQYGAI